MSERNGAREAIERVAGRIVKQGEANGQKPTHDQAMRTAREAAKRYDRKRD